MPPLSEELDHRQVDAHVRCGHAHLHERPRQVTGQEGLFHDLRVTDCLDADVGAVPPGQRPDGLDRVGAARVDGVRGAERGGLLEFARIEVDADDGGRPGELRPGDGGTPDAAAAEHGHGVAEPDLSGEHGRPEPRHDAAPEQPHRLGSRCGVDLGALAGRHQRLVGERADAERRRQLRAVGQGHLLRRVVGGEAVPGSAPAARAALAAHRSPVQDHEVTGRQVGDVRSDGLDHAGRLVAQKEREVVVDAALAVMQVGVAHAARLDRDDRLARTGIGDDDRLDGDRAALFLGHDTAHFLSHRSPPRVRAHMMPDRPWPSTPAVSGRPPLG